ncbi:hypothetical protein ACFVDT_06905 [Streptomyces sp. NPDC057699]|uniref:hypothetical protein n=1 Tax=Streptomyces sp. NPDC057699 TaxID=3346220 RepID=UPI0036929D69
MAAHDPKVEMQIGGVWTDVTGDVLFDSGISHQRGRSGEGAKVDPAVVGLTLKSPNGRYANRNPLSPYYGRLGRNTPLRSSVGGAGRALYLPDAPGDARASTPDTAALDIVGDIDVRADLTPSAWAGGFLNSSWEVMSKYLITGNQRSWRLLVNTFGQIEFSWSPDGTNLIITLSTMAVPFGPGQRGAIRATLDVNNGASGRTVVFYTAPTMAGPWSQLGNPVTSAGVTSIYNSTTALEVGDISALFFDAQQMLVHAAEVRSGINGTVVANPVFSTPAVGASSFTDAAGRLWTLSGGATITDRRSRFVVEVPSWTPRWTTGPGQDLNVPIQAGGMLRRLKQGAKALQSALRRRVPTDANVLAYWPMEEGADARNIATSPLRGVGRLTLTHAKWASESSLPSSNPLPVLANGGTANPAMMTGYVPAPAGSPTGWHVRYVYKLDTPPTTLYTFMRVLCVGGTVAEWYIQQRDNASRIVALNDDGGTVFSQDIGTGPDLYNQWTSTSFFVSQSGGTVTWTVRWQDVGGDAGEYTSTFSGTIGRVRAVASPPGGYAAALDGMALGHIGVFSSSTTAVYDGAITGYAGETAGARLMRLAAEERLPLRVLGDPAATERMGPQRPDTLISLLEECEAADGGILGENRDLLGLVYRTRRTLYNQEPRIVLPYSAIRQPFEPVDDDSRIRNDVTITRTDGSFGRFVLDSGPLSTAAPESGGVGVYDSSETLNVYDDGQTEQLAAWRVHLGTWDEARYPRLRLLLHQTPELIPQITALDVGDVVRVTGLPAFLPPGPLDLLVDGVYPELLTGLTWDATFACSPAGPWQVGVRGDSARGRRDSAASKLAAAATATATTLSVATASGPLWTTAASDMPISMTVGGETVTVTAISGTTSPQTFTVVRSQNGVVKPQLINTPISLARSTTRAL